VFEGYFSFLVDSFDCRIPTNNVDANEYMKEINQTYLNTKENYFDFYQTMKASTFVPKFTETKIKSIKHSISKYFEEMELYQKAYDNLDFVTFFFDDDCNLQAYVLSNQAHKYNYEKIQDYLLNTLPNLTNYISSNFYA
jgi:hypothetical protein